MESMSLEETNALKICAACKNCLSFCAVDKGGELRPLPSLIAEGLLTINCSSNLSETDIEMLKETYKCSLCGRCLECIHKLDVVELSYRLRRLLASKGLIPKTLVDLQHTVRGKKNAYGADTSARSMWVDFVGLAKIQLNKSAETLYYVGCTPSYRAQGQDITYAASLILNTLNEDWTILGADEWCCGLLLLAIGERAGTKELATHNVEFIESLGVKMIVSSCPSWLYI
ncbi:MAG: (Fe-S)-binding protein, partial [Nitrososphaerales archaeon]